MTASVTMLVEITRKLAVPRAFAVPYPLGYALGAAHDVARQQAVVRALLGLCTSSAVPLIEELEVSQSRLLR